MAVSRWLKGHPDFGKNTDPMIDETSCITYGMMLNFSAYSPERCI